MIILAIGAHICDMEFTCGAVLAKHARMGDEVHLLSTTVGEKGCGSLLPAAVLESGRGSMPTVEAYKKQKIEEGLKCAKKLGAVSSTWLDYPDAELPCDRKVQLEIAAEIRRIKPDIVITHWNTARHSDHYKTAVNVEKALWIAKMPTIETGHPRHVVSRLYYTDNLEDQIDFVPNVFVSVKEEDIATWQSAISEFLVGRGERSGFSFVDYYRHLAHVRGMEAKFKYAQAFYTEMNVRTGKLFGAYNPA